MVLLTCANVFLRFVWLPLKGTIELVGYFGAVLTAFALGYTQIKKGYIAVDVLVLRFSKRYRRLTNAINAFTCMLFFIFVTWQIFKYATILLKTDEVTETLHIIYYPFTYAVAFGCAILALVFLTEFLNSLFSSKEDKS
jgi:TRAP-type C4-dicarboxylate transport system permease small subunit